MLHPPSPVSAVVLLGSLVGAERIYANANIGLNELCEAAVPAKLRLTGGSIGIPLSPPLLKDAHLIDIHIVPARPGVRGDAAERQPVACYVLHANHKP